MPKSKSRKDKKRKSSGPVSPASPSESLVDKKCRIDSFFRPDISYQPSTDSDLDKLSESSFRTVDEPETEISSDHTISATFETTSETSTVTMPLSKEEIRDIAVTLKEILLPELLPELRTEIRSEIKDQIQSLRDYVDSEMKPLKNAIGTLQQKVAEIDLLHKQINILQKDKDILHANLDQMESDIDRQEQYSRRDCLRINGVLGDTGDHRENTDDKLLLMAREANIPLHQSDIDKSHRLGKPRDGFNRTVIVKFSNSKARDRVLAAKKSVNNIYINEDLSRYRQNLAFDARKLVREKKIEQTWVGRGGVIFAKFPGGERFQISSKRDMISVREGHIPVNKFRHN